MNIPILLTLAVAMTTTFSARASDAKQLWDKNCVKCHGPDGKGETKVGKKAGIVDLTSADVQGKFSDEDMFKAVKNGVNDKDGKIKMQPAQNLTDGEIKKLIAFVRMLKKEPAK